MAGFEWKWYRSTTDATTSTLQWYVVDGPYQNKETRTPKQIREQLAAERKAKESLDRFNELDQEGD